MAVLELDKEQILHLALQLKPEEQKEIAQKLVLTHAASVSWQTVAPTVKPRSLAGLPVTLTGATEPVASEDWGASSDPS